MNSCRLAMKLQGSQPHVSRCKTFFSFNNLISFCLLRKCNLSIDEDISKANGWFLRDLCPVEVVCSSVPQGLVLFNILINDLHGRIEGMFIKFADVKKPGWVDEIARTHKTSSKCKVILIDMNIGSHPSKCCSMRKNTFRQEKKHKIQDRRYLP